MILNLICNRNKYSLFTVQIMRYLYHISTTCFLIAFINNENIISKKFHRGKEEYFLMIELSFYADIISYIYISIVSTLIGIFKYLSGIRTNPSLFTCYKYSLLL